MIFFPIRATGRRGFSFFTFFKFGFFFELTFPCFAFLQSFVGFSSDFFFQKYCNNDYLTSLQNYFLLLSEKSIMVKLANIFFVHFLVKEDIFEEFFFYSKRQIPIWSSIIFPQIALFSFIYKLKMQIFYNSEKKCQKIKAVVRV